VAIFIISFGNKKIIYALCGVRSFPKSEKSGDVLKDGFILNKDNPLRKDYRECHIWTESIVTFGYNHTGYRTYSHSLKS